MQVTLEAIKFNHDPDSALADAFNIRKNESDTVLFPEWQRGKCFTADDSIAAYAINPRGRSISIQAKFKTSKVGLSKVKIRAIDARSSFSERNILGSVEETEVTFGANGESDFVPFTLKDVLLAERGVGINKVVWRWQFFDTGVNRWSDFARTFHQIYSVIDVPREPWSQTDNDKNTQLPWAEVLEVACDWAEGAQNVHQAAELITRNVYDLGLGLIRYQGSPATYAFANFECASFLKLLRGQRGMGTCLNCSDCATIVSTLANVLGCDTSQVRFGRFGTNPIILIGASKPGPMGFLRHEVAWTGDSIKTGAVFDACLQVDGDDKPQEPPFEPLLPTNLPFGLETEKHYRHRVDSGNSIVPKLPGKRRKIGNGVRASFIRDTTSLKLLEDGFKYETWKDVRPSEASRWTGVLVPLSGSQPAWQEVDERCQEFDDGTKLKSTFFSNGNTDILLREDLFECLDWRAARTLLLWLLGEYTSTKVERLEDPVFADVAFVAADDASAIFADGDSVVLIRSDCGKKLTLREAGLQISHPLPVRLANQCEKVPTEEESIRPS